MKENWSNKLARDLAAWVSHQDLVVLMGILPTALDAGFEPSGGALQGLLDHMTFHASEEQACKAMLVMLGGLTGDPEIMNIPIEIDSTGTMRVILWLPAEKASGLLGISRATLFRRLEAGASEFQDLKRQHRSGTRKPFSTFSILKLAVQKQLDNLPRQSA